MNDPEIADTVYHLSNAGRDFFQFTSGNRFIDVIHKSVRDWVENEAKRAFESDHNVGSLSSLFQWDDNGQLRLSLPIPSMIATHSVFENKYLSLISYFAN